MIHYLKTTNPYFEAVANGSKKFDFRKNDRDFKINDIVCLQEYFIETESYSGKEISATITFILEYFNGIQDGYCILSLDIIHNPIFYPGQWCISPYLTDSDSKYIINPYLSKDTTADIKYLRIKKARYDGKYGIQFEFDAYINNSLIFHHLKTPKRQFNSEYQEVMKLITLSEIEKYLPPIVYDTLIY